MNCEQIQELLSAFIDRQLLGAKRNDVRDHIAHCDACSKEMRGLIQVKQLLAAQTLPPVPAYLIPRIEHATVYGRSSERGWMSLRWLIPSLAFAAAGAWAAIHFYTARTPLIHPQTLEAQAPRAATANKDQLAWHYTAPFSTATQ